jgi:hypothetical protein
LGGTPAGALILARALALLALLAFADFLLDLGEQGRIDLFDLLTSILVGRAQALDGGGLFGLTLHLVRLFETFLQIRFQLGYLALATDGGAVAGALGATNLPGLV